MADFDSQLPVRTLATEFTTKIADSSATTINPAKEDGNLLAAKNDLDKFTFTATRLLIDGSGVTQPVSGTFWQATQPISAVSLPLPTGAATETTLAAAKTDLDKFTFTATRLLIDGSGVSQPISAVSLPLPTGAATETTLAAMSAKLPATLGQKTMANSFAVTIASDQSAIPVSFTPTSNVELPQYNTASAVAANATSTQTYSPASTVNLDGVDASASGQMKIEIQWGTTGSETTKAVFFTSKGHLQLTWRLPNPVSITNTMSIKVIRTNMDNQAMDVYSTIQVH